MSRHTKRAQAGEAGFTLVEFMVSIALGLVILAAVVSLFANTSSARGELERTSRQIENGRYAVELLSEDLGLAGFYGELNVAPIGAPAAVPDPCSTTATDWIAAIPVHVQGYDAGAGAPSCLGSNLKAGSDVVVVRRVRACVAGVSGCPAVSSGTPYLQVSLCSSEAATTPYLLGVSGATTYGLRLKDCATAAGLRQYLANTYFISTDNGAGQSIPTLKRRELTGAATIETPLVEGIDHLNVLYGIDNDGDGLPDAYTADPDTYSYAGCTTCTAPNNWTNVMTVQVFVLARNIEPSPGYTDTKTYTLGTDSAGAASTVGPFNDAYRRHVYTSVVRVANAAGRRDVP
jgi:type IV pilus assembly protein PilW